MDLLLLRESLAPSRRFVCSRPTMIFTLLDSEDHFNFQSLNFVFIHQSASHDKNHVNCSIVGHPRVDGSFRQRTFRLDKDPSSLLSNSTTAVVVAEKP